MTQPTPHADVSAMLAELVSGVTAILGARIVGIYLDGSLAYGDFDKSSDIDFVVVTGDNVSEPLFLELQAMHVQLSTGDSPWATQLPHGLALPDDVSATLDLIRLAPERSRPYEHLMHEV